MNLQHFFAMASNLNLSVESSFLIAIAVLACVFGAEIAGICILISKISHARRERLRMETEEVRDATTYKGESGSQNFAVALLLGAAPLSAQTVLLILSVGTAVAALVFVVLLIVFRAQGYSLISARAARVEEPIEEVVALETPEEYQMPEAESVVAIAQDEPYIAASAEEDPIGIFDETPAEEPLVEETVEEAVAEEPVVEEAVETVAETVEAAAVEAAPVSVIRSSEPVGLGQAPSGIPVYSSAYPAGQMPVIEKYITETYKEVIKETNTTTTTNSNAPAAAPAGEKYSPATEEILKAIAELMKLGTQLRMEKELAVEHPAVAGAESVPAFADADEDEHDADEIDEDDTDVEDAEDADADADGEKAEVEDDYESELFTGNERIVGFDEETGCYIVAHYRKSFEAKLIQARHETKKYYSEIKNALLSYEGTKDRISWTINTFTNDRAQVAKINMRARSLDLYLALDPASLEDTVYHGRDVSAKKKYAETPFLYKVNSPRKLALALELVQRTCEELGLSPIDIEPISYEEQYPFEATEDLIRRGLIREYLREEKPAVSFELDPDHAPDLPEEDGSVIPANANFTWEFDNEQPAPIIEPEPKPVAEPEPIIEPEPIVEPEPETVETVETVVEEAVPASTTTTTTTSHETVKTTERHYTERYVGTPMQQASYQMLSETTQPIEAKAEPTALAEPETTEPVETVEAVEAVEGVDETAEAVEEAVEAESYAEDVIADEPVEEIVEEDEELFEEPEEMVEETEETLTWDTLEEPEEVYEDEAEEVYEDETEEVYEDEAEEVYEDEAEEVYEDEAEEVYEDEAEVVYEDEAEEIYEEEPEEYEEAEEVEEEQPAPVVKPAATDSSVALLDVCCFDDHFENGAIVNLETLKQVGLAPESATTLKLYASGSIKGQYTVEANHFTLQAIEAINATDGTSIMIR